MRKWLASLVAPVAGSALLVLAVIVVGRCALSQLRDQDRYALSFADISCTPPPALSRADFLSEVQFLASWPDRLHRLDTDLPRQLAEVFIRHPWVKRVDRVEVTADGIRVRMTYRTPVLAVPRRGPDGPLRAVDAEGTLLPLIAVAAALPIFEGDVPPPAGGAGLAWGDTSVETAAATAAVLQPYQDRLRINTVRVD